MLQKAQRPLVCLHYGIGDVVMQLPVLEALRAHIPHAAITLLGAQPAIELFDDDRRWQSVQSVQAFGLRHWGDVGDDGTRAAVGSWIEQGGFDLILDVSHAVLAIKEAIWSCHRNILDTGEYLPANGLDGVQAIKQSVGLKWGLPVPVHSQPHLDLANGRLQFADNYLRRHLNGKPAVAISALSSSPLKRWPLDRLDATAVALCSRFDLPLMIFNGPQTDAAFQVAAGPAHPTIMVGPLHLLDTAALLTRCAILICNDTGLMHLAAAVGTPVVAVFGPTAESIYLPPPPFCRGVSSTVTCPHRQTDIFGPSPCLVQNCCLISQNSCIESIGVSTVLETAVDLLEQASKGVFHKSIGEPV